MRAAHDPFRLLLIVIAAAFTAGVAAQAPDTVAPNAHLQVSGMPPVPAALMHGLAPYTEFRPRAVSSWHPQSGTSSSSPCARATPAFARVGTPGGPAHPDHRLPREQVRRGFFPPKKPDTLVFARDTGGNEQNRVFRLDPGSNEPVGLTDADRRRTSPPGTMRGARYAPITCPAAAHRITTTEERRVR